MVQHVFYHPQDPAAGVVGAAFRVAGLRTRGETRAAVATAAHNWHQKCAQVHQLSPRGAVTLAEDTAQQHRVGALFMDSLGAVMTQLEAEEALKAAEETLSKTASPEEISYVKKAADALRTAANQVQEKGSGVLDRTIQAVWDNSPPGLAQAAVRPLLERAERTRDTMVHELGKTARTGIDTLREVGPEAMKTALAVAQEPTKIMTRGAIIATVVSVAALGLGLMLFMRTK